MIPIKVAFRTVGFLREDRVFISHRKEKHIFYKFKGLGVSTSVLMKLHRLGCHKIVLLLERKDGTTKRYEATPEDFLDKGTPYTNNENDTQKILSFKQMNQDYLTHWV